MVKIDALYLLLLVEAVLLLLGGVVFLFLRNRKWKRLIPQTPGPAAEEGNKEEISAAEAKDEADSVRSAEAGDQALSGTPVQASDEEEALRGIIAKQREKILELMCYQDLFESARGRLAALRDRNDSLTAMLENLQDAGDFGLRRDEALSELRVSSEEIESYIEVLGRENEKLAGRFRAWEEELRQSPMEKGE